MNCGRRGCSPGTHASMDRREGHACLASLAQGTVCKILDQEEVKPHKVRYYLEQRDPEFSEKMAEVLCVYRRVKLLKKVAVASKKKPSDGVRTSSPTTRSRVSRRSRRRPPTCLPSRTFMRPSRATTNTSVMGR